MFTIRYKIIGVLVVIGVIGAVLFQQTWVPRVTKVMSEAQTRDVRRQVEILADGILPYFLSSQFGAVHETLKHVEDQYDNWISVALHSPSGRRIYPLGEPPPAVGPDIVTKMASVSFRDEELAVLSVKVDLGPDRQRLQAEQHRLAFVGIAFILLVMTLIAYMVDRLVSQRLAKIASASDQVARGNFQVPLPKGSDEVGSLADRFSDMRDRIKEQTESLEKARRKAENALETRARFVATMSHEIRTPLNGIIPVADMLEQSDLDEEQLGQVKTIQKSSVALLSIVNDILDASKMDGGHLEMQHKPFSPEKLFEDAASIVRFSAQSKGIALNQNLSVPPGLECLGDEERLRQVLINILGNAVKFTNVGSVDFSMQATPVTDTRCHLDIEIADTGVGIPKDARDRIFDRFEQADTSTSRQFGGTGLGLAISYDLIKAMGGDISVTSSVGAGSTFKVSLELDHVDSVSPAKRKPAAPDMAATMGRSVLVVDDNEINREVASAMLAKLGCDVVTAEDGQRALSEASNRYFDVILMDLNMPEMDGLEATQRIRKGDSPNAETRIVALTASVQQSDMEKCRLAGMDSFLSKPLSEADLAKAVSA